MSDLAEMLASAKAQGYKEGSTEAIDKCIKIIKRADCTKDCRNIYMCIECMSNDMEKLKEQKWEMI